MTVESRGIRFSTTVLVTAIVLSLFAGGLLQHYVSYPTISERIDNFKHNYQTFLPRTSLTFQAATLPICWMKTSRSLIV